MSKLSPTDRARAKGLTNDYIRRVLRGNKPYVTVPYVDRNGRSATLAVIDDAPVPMTAGARRTAESYLAQNAGPGTATELPAPPTSADDRNQVIANYLAAQVTAGTDPAAIKVRAVAAAVGTSAPTVTRSLVWRAFKAWRDSLKVGQLRTRQLTAEMLAVFSDHAATDPADIAAENELDDLIADQRRDMADR